MLKFSYFRLDSWRCCMIFIKDWSKNEISFIKKIHDFHRKIMIIRLVRILDGGGKMDLMEIGIFG